MIFEKIKELKINCLIMLENHGYYTAIRMQGKEVIAFGCMLTDSNFLSTLVLLLFTDHIFPLFQEKKKKNSFSTAKTYITYAL